MGFKHSALQGPQHLATGLYTRKELKTFEDRIFIDKYIK